MKTIPEESFLFQIGVLESSPEADDIKLLIQLLRGL
jgi:hypothetical protein